MSKAFVPSGFEIPINLDTPDFVLRPIGVEHNESDYRAWTSSMDHIRATPGYEGRSWPGPMTVDENRDALASHVEDFTLRRGFTYTVLSPDKSEVIGCVYIYPSEDKESDAIVRSWVSKSHAHLDKPLYDTVRRWIRESWPFGKIEHAERG